MKKLITSAFLLLLSACAADQTVQAPVNYNLPAKITLDVQSINLVDRNPIQPASSPYNSNHFQPTIDDAIRQWAKDRLQAVGATGQAVVIIKDASLTQQSLAHDTDWFTRQQGNKYIAHAEVELEAKGHEGYALASAQASRFETLADNPTESERQTAYYNILNGLMKDLGQNLEASIQTHMRDFVVTAPILAPSSMPVVAPASQPIISSAPVYSNAPVVMQGGNDMPMNNRYQTQTTQPTSSYLGQPLAPMQDMRMQPSQPMPQAMQMAPMQDAPLQPMMQDNNYPTGPNSYPAQ
jgi:hypothetical protein